MTVTQPALQVVEKGVSSDGLCPLNLLNDFAELGTFLLAELERAAVLIPAQDDPSSMAEEEMSPASPQEVTSHLLDAFLLAVGMHQILEDYLHRDVFALAKISRNLPRLLPAPLGKWAAAAAKRAAQACSFLRAMLPGELHLIQRQRAFAAFVLPLADQIACCLRAAASDAQEPVLASDQMRQSAEELLRVGRELLASVQSAPEALQRSVIRLPACFRSFDQRPADCRQIVEKFAARWPERDTPLVVMGVRTSGSYFAPLYAAFLRALGYQQVQTVTLRPGQVWLPGERAWLRKQVQPAGRALLVDDPPNSGASLIQIVHVLEEMGIAPQCIHPAVPIFGSLADLPPLLQGYEAIYLPWKEWAIHRQLTAPAVEERLGELLSGQTMHVSSSQSGPTEIQVAGIRNVERLPLPPEMHSLSTPVSLPEEDLIDFQQLRGHVRALYQAQLLDRDSGKWFTHQVYVKGVGLGYFGAHSLTLAKKLSAFLPAVYGVRDGLLFRAWIPEKRRLSSAAPVDTNALAERMAAYAAAHQHLLALPKDVSADLIGRHPLWQRGNDDFARHAFGRIAALVRPALLGLAKYLVLQPVKHAAVVDGSMAPRSWFLPAANGQAKVRRAEVLKVEFDDRVFSNQNLDYCDVFYDLASAAAYYELQTGDASFADRLRQHYAKLTDESSSDERWLLYQAIALNLERSSIAEVLQSLQKHVSSTADQVGLNGKQPSEPTGDFAQRAVEALEAAQRTISRIQERYIGERFMRNITLAPAGPLCAIDLDGVLETNWHSSVATTPAGALALRALAQHGYRPVIATGRSLDEVRERCQAYRLAGGMGEYGAVIYNHQTGETRLLLSSQEQADLDALRSALRRMQGVYVSSAYRSAVRAYQVKGGKLCGLTAEMIEEALQQVAGRERLRPIIGLGQTDFMVSTVDKGTGLTALAEFLGGPSGKGADEPILAFAAGDTTSDLPMFKLAKHSFAPANADAAVRESAQMNGGRVEVMQVPFQAGLLQATAQFLGHDTRRCALCRPPAFSQEAHLFLTLLAARDRRGWGKLRQAALLARRLSLAKRSDERRKRQRREVEG